MNSTRTTRTLEAAKAKLAQVMAAQGLRGEDVRVTVSALTTEQAIGLPDRRDFPIVEGRERVIEATVNGDRGQAFTDSPGDFDGTLSEVMALPLSSNRNRAIFVATLNAVLRSMGMLEASLHCRDEDPEKCAKEIAGYVHERWTSATVGLVGFNPAIAEALVAAFGADRIRMTDLNRKNAGTVKFGVPVWDGRTHTPELIRQSQVVIVTGTTMVNGTFDGIWDYISRYDKGYLIYGVTAAGVCRLVGLESMCPYSRDA
jgi:uncharacterized protein (DUF4213/DUF364 family)